MLAALSIRDVVLIETAELRFGPGLNVLTGETGAGKSILLDALGFVLGWRGRAELVRAGAGQGEVTAEFLLPPGHPAEAVLAEAGLPAPEEALILRRTATPDGRRQAWVNDRRVSVETLRALADTLVELHGQADDRGLLDPRGHRALLDAFAGAEADLAAVRAAWATRAAAARALAEAGERLAAAGRDADYLRHAAAELERLAPEPGEEAALDARRRALRAAERIREDVARAAEALGPDGAEGRLLDAMRWLERAAPQAEGGLDAALDALPRTLAELAEATGALAAVLEAESGAAGELERVEERLFALRAAARKHQVDPEALPDLAAGLRARLDALDAGASGVSALAASLAAADHAHAAAAATLSARRREAAARLDARMAEELPPLKLERARFATEIAGAEPGPDGADRVAFLVATAPGAAPGPIGRIASGGELSRFLLALKVCLSARADGITLIFDEIDRGVGGATADAVGRRLAALGAATQVLVVTHAPQVAARGVAHWQVGKRMSATRALTEVLPLGPDARVEEIARMLAGDVVTDAARAAARALLAG
ncbi:DNA repair protein RecN [Amaricoccus sp.]|uniref:DNA repair protein RecN n=1 Tax=Amaricoccus sp. TaxID=1872485 RepID=UPI001B556868|nr:DNA repair protein RecN [Amaricoccus sp.]MBP7002046.1 DNA repair protein RecN [Amaricoccus sp.]